MVRVNPIREPLTIWWIKRDFRLYDNQALTEAIKLGHNVLPLFVFEPDIMQANDFSAMHLHAQLGAGSGLRASLQNMGNQMMFAKGEITHIFDLLLKEYSIEYVLSHEETGNGISFERDKRVAHYLKQKQIVWKELPQNGVIRRLKTRDNRQAIIKSRLFEREPIDAPISIPQSRGLIELASTTSLPSVTDFYCTDDIEKIQFDQLQIIGETRAHTCLQSFLRVRGKGYSGGISSPNSAFRNGSRLSAHLAWGTISLHTLFHEGAKRYFSFDDDIIDNANQVELDPNQVKQWKRSLNAFQSRLHWHCHFIQRLESSPSMEFKPLNSAYNAIKYEDSKLMLDAWCEGRTGYPLVDACMRCLNAIGFLNFRMRAFVVSFAVYGLHLDWRTIHPHLARIFYDYEPGIHLAQLQMQAGVVGINTIRVYNPTKQLIDQDPNCKFVKQWVSELRGYSVPDIQSYESIPLADYPKPIVDFSQRAKLMKDQISNIRKSLTGKIESKKVLHKHGSRKTMHKKSKIKQDKNPQLDLFN